MKSQKTSHYDPTDAPKHLRNKKSYQKGQMQKGENRKTNLHTGTAFLIVIVLVGTGLFVYNMDDVYLNDKNDITMSFSNNFRQGGEAPIVITVSDFDGAPAANEEVKVELSYTVENTSKRVLLSETTTDAKGITTPQLELPDNYNGTAELIVSINDQELVQPIKIDKPLTGFTAQDEERLRILISTDKPIYQPDQQINIRTLAMFGETKGVYTDDIIVEVDDPEGNKLSRAELDCNDYGIASTNFTVTDQMPMGNYKIIAKAGEKMSEKSVTVKRYVLPRFDISFSDIKNWYTVDEDIAGEIYCKYFFGKPVKGDITFKVRTCYGGIWDEVYKTTGTLGEDGKFAFNVPAINYAVGLPSNQDNGLIELNATITDASGHTETKLRPVTIAHDAVLITTIADTNIKGATSRYLILTQAPDGSTIDNANVTAKLDGLPVYTGASSSKGIAQFDFKFDGQEELEITAEKGGVTTTEEVTLVSSTGIKLTADKMYYSVGDMVEFDVYYAGESYTRWVYYDVISNGFTITTGCFKLSNRAPSTGRFTLDLTPEMAGTSYVRVYKIEKDETVVSDRLGLAIAPTSDLEITIEKDDEIYNPNQDVTLKFIVTDGDVPVQGALGISIIDQSLYALSERFGGFEDLYFELEEKALEPQYMIWEYIYSLDTSGDDMPLAQTSVVDPGEYLEGYSYPQIGIQSSRNTELDNAEEAKAEAVDMFWIGVFIVVFVLLAALMFFGIIRSRPSLTISAIIIMILATVMGGLTMSLETAEDGEPVLGLYEGLVANTDTTDDKTDGTGQNQTNAGGIDDLDGDGMNMWEGEERDTDVIPTAKTDDPDPFPTPPDADSDNDGYKDAGEDTSGTDPLDTDLRREREVRVRDYFPETWYWNPVLITDAAGTAQIELTTPDSITTWEVKAVASTLDAKVGVNNENLTVFQEFFIEPDIPVSVIRNDTFPLRIMIYNYDNVEHEVTVYLDDAEWFDALDETTKTVTVPADNVSKVMFSICALDVGEHNVTVSGFNGEVWDDVIKPMRVDPDGKRVSTTMNGKLADNQTKKETIMLSQTRVPASENAFVKLQGGVEAVLLDGAEAFIRYVSGCGEQSMSSLNIDILAFDTVTKVGTATEEKMFEYEHIVTQGIQHELQYLVDAKNGQGRGIVWFPDDEDVHQWLTSWGLITFQDAIEAGFMIDNDIIDDMQTWLLSQQEDDGSFVFPERGLYEFTNPILRAKTVSCTAYITRALIYSGYPKANTAIRNAVGYIEDHAKDTEVWDDPYSLSLVLTVLEDADGSSTLRSQLATRLDELKIEDTVNNTAYWSSGTSMITDSDDMIGFERYGYGSNYHTIETTGYAVMALAKNRGAASATVQKGIRYLVENRQGLGGWYSTQDTIVAFQALKTAGMNTINELTVEVKANNVLVAAIDFDESNIDITYLLDLRPYLAEDTDITLTSTGRGSVMYQVYAEEYIPWAIIGADRPQELVLNITYDTTTIKVDDRITADLELEYVGAADHIKMVLIDLRAPVGFSFVEGGFADMKSSGTISQYEINDRQAYIYIEDLSFGEKVTFTYQLEAKDPIKGTIQGVNAYDMYNPMLTTELEPVEVTVTD